MYDLKYDFKQFNDVMSVYMDVLVQKSTAKFQQQIRNGQVRNSEHDADALAGGIENLEEYLYYNFQKSPETFHHILNSTMNKVKTISVLPYEERGIYGRTEVENKMIFINPDLSSSRTLTGEERTRLYMAHELGHVINDGWMKKVLEYCNQNLRLGRLTQEHAQLIYDGFSMLDEATTQDRAEDFVYEFSGKRRPKLAYYRNGRLFDGQPYQSNFDYYGELQAPATMFARTLRGIGKEKNDMRALSMLSDRAISPNFFNNILNEYSRDGQMPSFIKEVQYMGLLKRASYANFGHSDPLYLQNSSRYLQNLGSITSQMRDYREPFTDGDGR